MTHTQDRIQRWRRLLPLILLPLLLLAHHLVAADGEPTAIDLDSFTGEGMNDAIRVLWSTETEFGVAGYRLKRSPTENGTFNIITVTFEGNDQTFIPAQANNPSDGADYEVIDSMPDNGQTFWYKLVELGEDSSETEYGPIEVTAGEVTPTPTATPIVLGGTATPSPQSTTAGSTATATSSSGGTTPTVTVTGTPPATNTPQPTATGGAAGTTTASTATATNTNTTTTQSVPAATNTAQAIGQTNPTETPDAYPGAGSADESAATAEAYPGADPATEDDDSYPGGVDPDAGGTNSNGDSAPQINATPNTIDGNSANPATIGGTDSTLPPPADAGSANRPASAIRGSAIMWAGFIAALLIFAAGLFGSIILFSRQRARDNDQ